MTNKETLLELRRTTLNRLQDLRNQRDNMESEICILEEELLITEDELEGLSEIEEYETFNEGN